MGLERRFRMGGLTNTKENRMKKSLFLYGCLFALLVSACNDEIVVSETGTPTIEDVLGKIVITLPTNTQTEDEGKPSHGTVDVDKGHILIFSTNKEQPGDYLFEKKIDVTFSAKTFNGNVQFRDTCTSSLTQRYMASADFQPEATKLYKIYAYAYKETNGATGEEGLVRFSLDEKQLQDRDETLAADKLASINLTSNQPTTGQTLEIYGGFMDEYIYQPYPIQGWVPGTSSWDEIPTIGDAVNEVKNYGGSLKRQTGRIEINIDLTGDTDNQADIDKIEHASLVVEKYHWTIPVGMMLEKRADKEEWYFPNPFPEEEKTIAQVTPEGGHLQFCVDMFPIDQSKMFIEIKYTGNDTPARYQIRVNDKWDESIAVGVVIPIAKENRISVISNYWMGLKATYKQLTNRDNWTIITAWGEDYIVAPPIASIK